MSRILVTGSAGFIGFHLCRRLLEESEQVVGVDNLNDYYDVNLKNARLAILQRHAGFQFVRADLADRPAMEALFSREQFTCVVNLAAQAGVRYSITHPQVYIDSNVVGFANILEGCRHSNVGHLVYASSSSVYGASTRMPFSTRDHADHPISLYAATKKANELLSHTYAHLFKLPCTGLRFFTVYGPWGRPDMALFKFTRNIIEGRPIDVYNYGNMRRDFTYVDDIVEGVRRVMSKVPMGNTAWDSSAPDPSSSAAPYRVYNIGNHAPIQLTHLIHVLEEALHRKADINLMPMQPGDVPTTFAEVDDLVRDLDFAPSTAIDEGIARFVEWYQDFYSVPAA